MKYEPRYYQTLADAAVFDAWLARDIQRPALVQATGTGKTVVFAGVISRLVREFNRRVVLLVHRDELVDQAVEKINEVDPDLVVGIIKAERHDLKADVWVASVQSLVRRLGTGKRGLAADFFDAIITDECFVAGTRVGDQNIEDIRPGDLVPSADGRTGDPCSRRVVRTMSKVPSSLVRVSMTDGESVICTPDHPFLTTLGWVDAGQLDGATAVRWRHSGRTSRRETGLSRVAHIQVLEPGSDGTYGGLCPGGLVYNLEVEQTHTYRVGSGLVAHNCHHAAAESYLRIYRYFGGLPEKTSLGNSNRDTWMLGVTATLARADGIPLGHIWQEVVYEYGTARGIQDGFLVMPHAERVRLDELDLSKIKTMAGDWQQVDLGAAMIRSGRKLGEYMIAHDMDPKRPGRVRRGIVFAPTVACAFQWAEDFADLGIRAKVIYDKTPKVDRKAAYKATHAGENDVLLSVMVLTEGFDLPSVETVYIGRPTKSVTLYTQMVGRGLRPCLETGKTQAFVRDVCGVMNDKLKTLIDLGLPKACDCQCSCTFAHLCPKACRCPRSKKGKLKRPCVLCAKTWREQPKAERDPCMHYVARHVVTCHHRCDGLGNPGPFEEDENEEILDPEAPEPKDVIIDESEIVTVEIDLFDLDGKPISSPRVAAKPKTKPKAWRMTANGRPYLPSTTTFDYWIFLHQDPDNTYSVGELSKQKRTKAQRIATGLTFAEAVAVAEENHPTNGWLGRPLAGLPSEGQLAALKNRGVDIPSGCTKQQASELLSDLFASRALD